MCPLHAVPYDEVLGAWFTTHQVGCSCLCRKEHTVVVAALARARGNASEWRVKEHRLVASNLEQAKEWVAAIGSALQLCHDRCAPPPAAARRNESYQVHTTVQRWTAGSHRGRTVVSWHRLAAGKAGDRQTVSGGCP